MDLGGGASQPAEKPVMAVILSVCDLPKGFSSGKTWARVYEP